MAFTFKGIQTLKGVHVNQGSAFEKAVKKIVVKSNGKSIFPFKDVQKPKDVHVNWVRR